MGPRIILRGAIPIDSNIGGYGHRPLVREAKARSVSCGCVCLSGFCSVVCVCVCVCCCVGPLVPLALLSIFLER